MFDVRRSMFHLIDSAAIPPARLVANFADGKHHRHLHEHAHDRGQGRAGAGPKQRDGHGHRQFEEIARADERAGRRDVVRRAIAASADRRAWN